MGRKLMNQALAIGTRGSTLAGWQAQQVATALTRQSITCRIHTIVSEGDQDQVTPLYAMGVEGIFTRALDQALLSGTIDAAVHSFKDVPLQLAKGLTVAAVLERGPWQDVLVGPLATLAPEDYPSITTLGTCSIRRRAQWLHRYPATHFEWLRGNMETRLQKLRHSGWHGAIMAMAGLSRIDLLPPDHRVLPWMLPAPAQGAIVVVAREDDKTIVNLLQQLNHAPTAIAVAAERQFLDALMGGCATPIAALATIGSEGLLQLNGNLTTTDGRQQWEVSLRFTEAQWADAGRLAAEALKTNMGGYWPLPPQPPHE